MIALIALLVEQSRSERQELLKTQLNSNLS